jgi:hypothetical protein
MPADTFFRLNREYKTSFHNLCTTMDPPPQIKELLWLGLKFNLEKALPKPAITTAIARLRRDIRIKFHIDADGNNVVIDKHGKRHTLKTPGFDPKLYIKSQTYDPEEASPAIEAAINAFEHKLTTLTKANRCTKQHNLPASARLLLRNMKNNTNFIVLNTDKNLGPAILERSVYITRCLTDHLRDTRTYKQLTNLAAQQQIRQTERLMQQLILHHRRTLEEHERTYFHRVFQIYRRIPQFYTIPKVHKKPWKTRPIVSCVNSTLGYLSKYVDRHLQKVVHLCPAYLRDSQTLLDKLHDLGPLPKTAALVTADAVSMYTNIDTPHGLTTLRKWFSLHESQLPIGFPTDMILDAIHLIMTTNVFQFDDTFWLQLTGTAMGTSLACMYATIYYSYHEETHILQTFARTQAKPHNALLFYARLIDDAFQIWDLAKLPPPYTIPTFVENLQHNMAFGTLQWEAEPPQPTVNFLDLTLQLTGQTITSRTFIKPMNLHLYIPPHSAHSPGVLKSLVFGTLQRYWKQNSDRSDYINNTRNFHTYLLDRGYTDSDLDPLFREAAHTIDTRHNSNERPHNQSLCERRLFLHWEYHPRDISRRSIRAVYEETLEPTLRQPPLSITQFTVAYHNPRSLRNCLTKTQLKEPPGLQASDYVESLEHTPANL